MSVHVPFVNIDRIHKRYGSDLMRCVETVFTHGKVLMGPEIDQFEAAIAKRCQRKYAAAVGSCTDALFFALVGGGVKPGDEVLVTGFSFIASVSAIIRTGAVPVFVDIDPDDFMMSLPDAQRKVTPRTKALVAVHLFGQSLPMDVWEKFARQHDLLIVEDAAQSLGSSYQGTPVGKMGLASCMSFDPTKIVGAFGNGGVLLTDDQRVFELTKKLHYHGKDAQGDFAILGYNSRMATFQAALLTRQLQWLDGWISRRQEVANMYAEGFKGLNQIQTPLVRHGTTHIYHKYVLKVDKRDALKKDLESRGIQTMIHYSKALYEQPVCRLGPSDCSPLAHIEDVKKNVLSLPIYPELEQPEIDHIIDSVREFYR